MVTSLRPVGDDFELRVLQVFERKQRPVLIGEVSLDVGYRLEVVEHHLEALVVRGALRHISASEKAFWRLHDLVTAYVLVDRQKFTGV